MSSKTSIDSDVVADTEPLVPELSSVDSKDASPSGGYVSLSESSVTYSSRSEILAPFTLLTSIFRGFWDSRELAWRIFVRNLNSLYRQTALGLFWAFLPPLANTAIWIFLKSQNVFEMGETGVDSTVYILTGMILWQGFIDAFQFPMDVVNKNKNMLAKLNFPRESLLLVGVAEVVFNLAIRMILLAPAFLFFQVSVGWGILLAPLSIMAMIFFGAAMGVFLMPIGFLYKDVGRFIAMFIPFWMIITPVIYVPPSGYPANLLNWVNPASPLLLLSRDLMLLGESMHWQVGIIFGVLTLPLTILGLIVYRVSLPIMIERMPA